MYDRKTGHRIFGPRIFRWRSYSDEPGSDCDKLEEARFFLRYLDEAQNRPKSQTQTPFRYYLSAFLGAAYSVEHYLRTEVAKAMRQQARRQNYKELFVEWFTALPQEKQALWDSLMNNRGSEIHVERTKTVTKEKAVSAGPISRPLRLERNPAYAAHYVMQLQVAGLLSRNGRHD